jgi:hypothetical protein
MVFDWCVKCLLRNLVANKRKSDAKHPESTNPEQYPIHLKIAIELCSLSSAELLRKKKILLL